MYEIVVLETARFRPAQYKNSTRGSVFEKKNAVDEEKEGKLPVF